MALEPVAGLDALPAEAIVVVDLTGDHGVDVVLVVMQRLVSLGREVNDGKSGMGETFVFAAPGGQQKRTKRRLGG